jgi:hypothetical protein
LLSLGVGQQPSSLDSQGGHEANLRHQCLKGFREFGIGSS